MKRRQFKHKWRTLQDIFTKKQRRSSIWKFTSLETLTQIRNLSWSEMNRLQKKRGLSNNRGIRFRSSNRQIRCASQNVVQMTNRRDRELRKWEDKISEEHRGKGV